MRVSPLMDRSQF